MKSVLFKTTIPESKIFVVQPLKEKHFDPYLHSHTECQLFVSLAGTGTRFIGNNISAFKPGELTLTGPNLPHLWRSDELYFRKDNKLFSKGIVIYFNENFLGNGMMEKEEMKMIKKLIESSKRGIDFFGQTRKEIIKMMEQLSSLQGIDSVIHLLRILKTLAFTKEYQFISSVMPKEAYQQRENERLNQVYTFVLKNFARKISLGELADLVCMTPTSFSRFFTMHNNKSFFRFVTEIRVKHACKLITETDTPMSQISYASGFTTLSNFNKQFKQFTGKRPLEYKKEFMSI